MIISLKDFNLKTIADSGQIFRFNKIDNIKTKSDVGSKKPKNDCPIYELINQDKYLLIKDLGSNKFGFSCTKKEFDEFYTHYFDLDNNYNKYKKVALAKDTFLKSCIDYGKGLKILNQDPFEMLISFIISQRKSIPAIKTSIERLSKTCGKKMQFKDKAYYAFPTAVEIIKNKSKLSSCGLGYRLPYILEASYKVMNHEIDLDSYYKLSTDELHDKLLSIKGVGEKVASCIMLFAYHRIDICPKDVWINRVIEKKYDGFIPKQYEKYQGIIQQYWFYYAKDHKVF